MFQECLIPPRVGDDAERNEKAAHHHEDAADLPSPSVRGFLAAFGRLSPGRVPRPFGRPRGHFSRELHEPRGRTSWWARMMFPDNFGRTGTESSSLHTLRSSPKPSSVSRAPCWELSSILSMFLPKLLSRAAAAFPAS